MIFNSKKLSKEDLEELKRRTDLINSHILIAQALEAQKQVFIIGKLSKYGLDGSKNYEFDLITGKIKEAKEQPKKPQ